MFERKMLRELKEPALRPASVFLRYLACCLGRSNLPRHVAILAYLDPSVPLRIRAVPPPDKGCDWPADDLDREPLKALLRAYSRTHDRAPQEVREGGSRDDHPGGQVRTGLPYLGMNRGRDQVHRDNHRQPNDDR